MFCVKAYNMFIRGEQDNVASFATNYWVEVWSPTWDSLAQIMKKLANEEIV